MRRREFITTSWSLPARAQQPAMPVIGFLSPGSPESDVARLTGIRQGLKESGYVEGQNVAIEYRFAHGQNDRLPALATDLVDRHTAGMVTAGTPATLAAKAATATVPIIFSIGVDPVQFGLAASLNRPGGNKRKRETILKTDRRNLLLELGQAGKFSAKSSGWDENRVFLEGDVLEVSVVRGAWVLTHVPAKPRASSTPLVEHYFPTE
jgi:hypothetical protein